MKTCPSVFPYSWATESNEVCWSVVIINAERWVTGGLNVLETPDNDDDDGDNNNDDDGLLVLSG